MTNYLKRQSARLAADPRYPRRLYVPQRMRYGLGLDSPGASAGGDGPSPVFLPDRDSTDALGAVARWLTDPDGRFVLVLGDFGTGKTFLLRQVAHRLTETPGAPVPLLIELRALQKARSLDELVAQHLVSYIKGFSSSVRRIFEFFEFENEIEKMREANILYLVVSKFCDVDLSVFN